MANYSGSCLCGEIKYEINGEPVRAANCHCDDCRKATGASYSTNFFFNEDDIVVTQGTPKEFAHSSDKGNTMTKQFCGNCGSQLFGSGSRGVGMKSIKAGSMDDPSGVVPALDIYISRKLPGVVLSDDTEHHEEMLPR